MATSMTCGDSSRCRRNASIRRCSPNSSPASLNESVIPSVYSTSVSPGKSWLSRVKQSHSVNSPRTVQVESSRSRLSSLLLRRDDSLERLDSTCTVLGLFTEWDCLTRESQLFPGDTLVLYTDGITDSFNEAGEEFGEQRLIEALRRHRELSPQVMLVAIVDEVRHFSPHEQQDDITLIVATCRTN